MIRFYDIYLLISGIVYFGYLFYTYSSTTIKLNHDSFTTKAQVGRGKLKTLYYSDICKIEYKHIGLGDYFYFFEPHQQKYSIRFSPQIFSPKDIRFVLNTILAKNSNIQLDQRTQNFLFEA